ncbi:tyrosine-protein kinase domain-containing protein [Calidifontibacter terrae]
MTIVDLVRILRRNAAVVVVFALLGLGLATAYTMTRPTVYIAGSTAVVVSGDSLTQSDTISAQSVTVQRASMYSGLVGSSKVADRAQTILKQQGRPNATGSVSATSDASAPFIRVTASAANAKDAQALANATLLAIKSEGLRLETFAKTQGQGDQSDAALEKLTGIHTLVYSPAALPGAPQRPDLKRNLAVGLLFGALLGALVALVRRAFDVRVRTQQEVEEITGRSVLGVVPQSKQLQRKGTGERALVTGGAGEAMRQLRTNLRFVNIDAPPRAIVVTSPAPGDGKSTVAAHLARLMASSGQSTVLIDCDLRLPTQNEQFGVDGVVGLTQVLAGDIPVDEAMIESGVTDLLLLPAGRTPPNPSELLGSRAMRELIRQLATDHLVLLDAPPMLAVTDAALLGASSDGVILVTRMGNTHKMQLAQSARLLEQASATLLGTVMNNASAKRMGDVVYGYGYNSGDYAKYRSYYAAASDAVQESELGAGASRVDRRAATKKRAKK